MACQILVADDHKIFREGLRALIERQDGMSVVAEAEDGRRAVRLAEELSPDIVVMDVSMPQLNGFEATRQIVERVPRVKVLALSMHSEEPYVGEMLSAGASGYLLKDCAFEELAGAIDTVMSGRVYLSPDIAARVVEDYVRQYSTTRVEAPARLSGREREVVQLLAEGKAVKEIAGLLHVSAKTVETHKNRVMKKLSIDGIAGLTKWAIRTGLTSL
jgi:two-component system, NarL family, response regulator NreC